MSKLFRTRGDRVTALVDLAQTQRATSAALMEVAREQRITNLIVRSQVAADPQLKNHLLTQAEELMAMPRRRDPYATG